MLAIIMADVVNVFITCKPYLIGFGIVLAIALIVLIAAFKLKKTKRKGAGSAAKKIRCTAKRNYEIE